MALPSSRPLDRAAFEIAVICALPFEADMVKAVFDRSWDNVKDTDAYKKAHGDPNSYSYGKIGDHNIVLVHMPNMGGISAATVAANLRSSYTKVRVAFVVGICGVVPTHPETGEEIFLGDCIISANFVQLDFGRYHTSGFIRKTSVEDSPSRANVEVRSFITMLKTHSKLQQLESDLAGHLGALQEIMPGVVHPGLENDRLFKPSYEHKCHPSTDNCIACLSNEGICRQDCASIGCDNSHLIMRKRLAGYSSEMQSSNLTPRIHFGRIGISNGIIRSAIYRDSMKTALKLVAFEMESSGVAESLPTIIVRSGCDYADSHKNKTFQAYAAAVAAAALKAVLSQWISTSPAPSKDVPEDSRALHFSSSQINANGIEGNRSRENVGINMVAEGSPASRTTSVSKICHWIPFLQNSQFVGRQQILRDLENQLLIQRSTREITIYGLGGVGKTQLALAFCYVVKEKYPDCSIFWLSALSIARLKQDYFDIARVCSVLPTAVEDEDSVVQRLQHHLGSRYTRKWLLIVDNADDRRLLFGNNSRIRRLLPKSELGMVLFTTRARDVAVDLTGHHIMHLDALGMEDAKRFMKEYLRQNHSTSDDNLMTELLEQLACLPLAITQNTETEATRLLSHGFEDNTRDLEKQSSNAIMKTWVASFEDIQREVPAAAELLYLLACVENKAIPVSMLPVNDSSEGDLSDALGVLHGYSFIDKELDGDYCSMHRLVRNATRSWMLSNGILQQKQALMISHILKVFPTPDWTNKNSWREYMPHAIRIVQETMEFPSQDRADLCYKMCLCLTRDRRAAEAVEYISLCLSWRDEYSMGEFDIARLKARRTLGVVNGSLGNLSKAIDILQDVLSIQNKYLPTNDPERIMTVMWLGFACIKDQRTAQANELLNSVLEAPVTSLPEDNAIRLRAQHYLAWVYQSEGLLDRATQLLEQVMMQRDKVLVDDHPDRMVIRYELNEVRKAIRAFSNQSNRTSTNHTPAYHKIESRPVRNTQPLSSLGSQSRTTCYPKLFPWLLHKGNWLAYATMSDEQVKRSIKILEEARNDISETHAQHRLSGLDILENLALAYDSGGRLDEAICSMLQVIDVQQKLLPADHPNRLECEDHLSRMRKERSSNIQKREEKRPEQSLT